MADPRFRVRSRGEVFDSSIAAWIPDTKTAAGGGGGGSTQVAVSSVSGVVSVSPTSTAWAGLAGFHFDSSGGLQVSGVSGGGAGSTQVTVSQLLDSSGGSIAAGDSANSAIRVNVVAGSAAGSTIVTVSTVAGRVMVDQQSTVWQIQMAQYSTVVLISGNSTVFQGTSPWVIAGNSTVAPLAGSTWATRPIQSSAADLQMTATPAAGSTWNVRCIQSSAADLNVTIRGNSTSFQGGAPWTIAGNSTVLIQVASTSAQTSIPSTTTANTTILAANANRKGACVFNDSASDLWLLLNGATESTTIFSLKVPANGYYEVPSFYTGIVKGHFTSTAGGGAARVTEFLP